MKTSKNRENHSIKIALILTILLHFLFYLLLNFIHLNNKESVSDQVIFLNFKTFEKPAIKNLNLIQNKTKQQSAKNISKKQPLIKNKLSLEKFYTTIDSNISKSLDSLTPTKNTLDSLRVMERFVLENPSLISLRMALKENIKKGIVKKTDAKLIEEKFQKAMSDYYKAKYPTPPYKFGERGTGNLINIPIEDVIELFK